MIDREHPATARRSRSRAQLQRDAALARISRARRWLILAAAGLTAGFSALVSAIAPGRSLASRSRTVAHSSGHVARAPRLRMPPLESAGQLGLQGPSQAPQPAPAPQASAPQPAPAPQASQQPQPAPTPAPAPSGGGSSGGGGAVSGGS